MSLLFSNKVSQAFASKIEDISGKLGIDPNWIMFLIDFESAGSFSASVPNGYNCYGLIQFCPDQTGGSYKTIDGTTYTMEEIAAMSEVRQLDLVYDYLKGFRHDIDSYYDLYFSILWPSAIGQDDSYVIRTGSNPIFDLNKNGTITVGEVKQFLDNRVKQVVPKSLQDSFKKKEVFCEYIKRRSLSAA